ncbi:MAG: hypothetical protein H6599_02455 [Flavobacteriales bacterium]|nr:hypothetical protein [Flavobacteriales bacterium]
MRHYIFFFILLATSCSSTAVDQEMSESIDQEIKIIELTSEVKNLEEVQKSPEYPLYIKDSISSIILQTNHLLDSLIKVSGNDYKESVKKCVNYFALDDIQSNEAKMDYLKTYYAYKICGPSWVSCGFKKVNSVDEWNKIITLTLEKSLLYNEYVDSVVEVKRKLAYPEIKVEELGDFDLVTFHFFDYRSISKEFKESACTIAYNDTTLNRLYADKLSVGKPKWNK